MKGDAVHGVGGGGTPLHLGSERPSEASFHSPVKEGKSSLINLTHLYQKARKGEREGGQAKYVEAGRLNGKYERNEDEEVGEDVVKNGGNKTRHETKLNETVEDKDRKEKAGE